MVELRADIPSPHLGAADTLRHIINLASHDLPFAAQVAQLAYQGQTLAELTSALDSLYRIALEHGHSFLPDLTDSLLRRVEHALEDGYPASSDWREVL